VVTATLRFWIKNGRKYVGSNTITWTGFVARTVAGLLDAKLQGVSNGVGSGELKQGMMHLHDPVLVRLNRLGSDDPGEAGDDDVVDRAFFQQSHQGDVIQIQVALAGMESDTGYPVPLRVAKRVRIGSLGYNERDPLTDDSMLQQRLDMSTDIRTENCDPGIRGGAPARLQSVCRHRCSPPGELSIRLLEPGFMTPSTPALLSGPSRVATAASSPGI
jgi:hypothetical protein